jgi:hypothetical protein
VTIVSVTTVFFGAFWGANLVMGQYGSISLFFSEFGSQVPNNKDKKHGNLNFDDGNVSGAPGAY